MDAICKFLSSDLSGLLKSIFSTLGFGSSTSCTDEELAVEVRGQNKKSRLVTRPSYTIRHHYPGPLITYDGEERCEPRLIRFSDLSCSKLEEILKDIKDEDEENEKCEEICEEEPENQCPDQEDIKLTPENEEKGCQTSQSVETCWPQEDSENELSEESNARLLHFVKNLFPKRKCMKNYRLSGGKDVASDISINKNPPTEEELANHEHRARAIYENYVEELPNAPSWKSLKPAEKLRFQWKALTGDELKETPYENFRLTFDRSFQKTYPWASNCTVRTEGRITWCNLDRDERMPFILQALLYQVASGAIDPEDHCAVRKLFHKMR
ncbi:uncharacterized protein LOC108148521 [Drosophila elegans]|uniref:uncharacterized protein LOC108148521 n=1 Tax=Drosophila elegans TaxID=30023 RepID=UPI0007E5D5C7|nr:uncharacterized protein LOC108148521 [Drosophila elegans]